MDVLEHTFENEYLNQDQFITKAIDLGIWISKKNLEYLIDKGYILPLFLDKKGNKIFSKYQVIIADSIQNLLTKETLSKHSWDTGDLNCKNIISQNTKTIGSINDEWLNICKLSHIAQYIISEKIGQSFETSKENEDNFLNPYLGRTFLSNEVDQNTLKLMKDNQVSRSDLIITINNKLPAFILRHNPMYRLLEYIPNFDWYISTYETRLLQNTFTLGKPIALANFYFRMLNTLISLNNLVSKSKDKIKVTEIFPLVGEYRECWVCKKRFKPKPYGGRKQLVCEKKDCKNRQKSLNEKDKRRLKIKPIN